MKVLGIDPGYERVGVAILEKKNNEKEKVLYSECFKTSTKLDFPERLKKIGERIEETIKEYKPDKLAIESLFLNTNQKTAMKVSEARGVIIYEAIKSGLDIFQASPPQIKISVTGYGRSNKEQVMKMVRMLVDINEGKDSDDELDAIATALTCFAYNKQTPSF